MSRWFPDVSTVEGITSASKGGTAAAIGFGGLSLLGLAVAFFTGHMPGYDSPGTNLAYILGLVAIALEATIAFLAAYRFGKQKGLWIGTIALLLFVLEICFKLGTGTLKGGWIFAYGAITLGLINGVRAARAARALGPVAEPNLATVFE